MSSSDLNPEQRARQRIDGMLAENGWIVQDYQAADLSAGRGIALREVPLTTGPCDYLLLVDRRAVGVIEAKKEGTTLSTVAEQSARYANSLPNLLADGLTGTLPFLYESTGVETLFRDDRDPYPRSRRVFAFHRPETLATWTDEADTLRARLKAMPTAHPLVTTGMRDCQVEAIAGLEQSFAENRPRALIHMATGAGKTFTACAFAYRLIKYAAREKAAGLVQAFRDYLAENQAAIDALQILYSRPYTQRLTESMLKELEQKLRDNHAAWTEDRLWDAFAVTTPAKVKGRSQVGRFADLVALVRFALEQQPVLAPFADSVAERFDEWLTDKAQAGAVFTPEQLAWLLLIRDHIATSLTIEPDDFDYTPFSQRGGLGKAHQLFGEELNAILEELNTQLVA